MKILIYIDRNKPCEKEVRKCKLSLKCEQTFFQLLLTTLTLAGLPLVFFGWVTSAAAWNLCGAAAINVTEMLQRSLVPPWPPKPLKLQRKLKDASPSHP